MAFVCAFETYFFNDLLLSGNYLFALFWGLLLFRDLRRVHTINQLTKTILKAANSPKKKDWFHRFEGFGGHHFQTVQWGVLDLSDQ